MKRKFIDVIAACAVLCKAGAVRCWEAWECVCFAGTGGWTADGVPLSGEALADNMTAAKYLRETYADCVWERK